MKKIIMLIVALFLQVGGLLLGDYLYYLQYGHSIGQCQLNGECK